MSGERTFASGGPLPADFLMAIQAFISSYVSANFQVTIPSNTSIQVAAAAGDDKRAIALGDGHMRYNTATVTANVPGTPAAGTLNVYVTANASSYTTTGTGEVDNTNYVFGLKITVPPATPSGTGAEALYRLIGTLAWDGTKITGYTPIAKLTPLHATTHEVGGTDPMPLDQISGVAWPGNAGWQYTKLVGGAALLWDTASGGVILRSNYNPATDRLVVAANPSWQLRLRSSTDQAIFSRAPATAGSPVYTDITTLGSNGQQSGLIIVDANVSASAAIAESKLALASDAAAGTASRRSLGTLATQAMAGNDARVVGPALKDDMLQPGVAGSPGGTLPALQTTTSGPIGGPISTNTQAGTIWLSLGGVLVRHVLAATTANVAGQINPPANDANPAVGSSNVRASTLWVTATGWGQAPTFQWTNSAAFATLTDATITANLGVVSLMNTSVLPPSPGGGAVAIATVWWRQLSGGSYVWFTTVDRRPAALGILGAGRGTANGTDYTTTSATTWVPVDAGHLQFRMESSNGAPVRVKFKSQGYNQTPFDRVAIGVMYDGAIIRATQVDMPNTPGTSQALELVIDDVYQPTAGSHLWTAVFMATSAGGTAALRNQASTSTTQPGYPTFSVEELMKSIANHDTL